MKRLRVWIAILGFIAVLGLGASPVHGYAAESAGTDGGNTFYPAVVW